jgi:hypothetical protein
MIFFTQSACKALSVAATGDLGILYFLKERKVIYQTTFFCVSSCELFVLISTLVPVDCFTDFGMKVMKLEAT